jgi:uncharacterized membrane protein HdeD (DUF308 family)
VSNIAFTRNRAGAIAVTPPHPKGGTNNMVGLGILLLIVGILLWLTVMPAIGWILMVIGVVLVVAGILMGAVWSFSRGRGGTVY